MVVPKLQSHKGAHTKLPLVRLQHDPRFEPLPPKPKAKAIVMAIILLVLGMALIALGVLHFVGHFFSREGAVRSCKSIDWELGALTVWG